MRTCSFEGCERKHYGQGYCSMHYKRVVRGGSPEVVKHVRHGQSHSLEYRTWSLMRDRCSNPKARFFKDYGGRGIRVCDRWSDFATFLQDMGPRPTPRHQIDRIDNNCGYAPWNCHWVLCAENNQNRRSTKLNKEAVLEIRSSQRSHKEMADKHEVTVDYIRRLRRGRFWTGQWPESTETRSDWG